MSRTLISILTTVLLAAAAWFFFFSDRTGDATSAPASADNIASAARDNLLGYIPADTPYAITGLEPIPGELMANWLKQMEAFDIGKLYVTMLEREAKALAAKGAGDSQSARLITAAADEMRGKNLRELMALLGYDGSPRLVALYGIDLVPVLRMELSDPAALPALIGRLEQRVGESLATGQVGNSRFWRIPLGQAPLEAVAGIFDRQLVVSLAPADAAPEVLETLFGLRRPSPSLADTDTLQSINRRFGYTPYASGYISSTKLLEAYAQEPDTVERAFLTTLGEEKPALDPTCQQEFSALAKRWPGINFGYTALSAEHIDMKVVLEMPPEITKILTGLRAPIPALSQVNDDTFFNMGFGLKLDTLPTALSQLAEVLASQTYQCPKLAPLNQLANDAREAGNNPAVFAAGPAFSSMHLIVSELEFSDIMTPTSGRGALLIASPNPQSLMAMAAPFAPGILPTGLKPDGKPVPVTLPPGATPLPANFQPQIAMTDRLLGIGFGPDAATDLGNYLAIDDQPGPLFVTGYSGKAYVAYLDGITKLTQDATQKDANLAEMTKNLEAIRDLFGKMISHIEMRVDVNESGLVLEGKETLAMP